MKRSYLIRKQARRPDVAFDSPGVIDISPGAVDAPFVFAPHHVRFAFGLPAEENLVDEIKEKGTRLENLVSEVSPSFEEQQGFSGATVALYEFNGDYFVIKTCKSVDDAEAEIADTKFLSDEKYQGKFKVAETLGRGRKHRTSVGYKFTGTKTAYRIFTGIDPFDVSKTVMTEEGELLFTESVPEEGLRFAFLHNRKAPRVFSLACSGYDDLARQIGAEFERQNREGSITEVLVIKKVLETSAEIEKAFEQDFEGPRRREVEKTRDGVNAEGDKRNWFGDFLVNALRISDENRELFLEDARTLFDEQLERTFNEFAGFVRDNYLKNICAPLEDGLDITHVDVGARYGFPQRADAALIVGFGNSLDPISELGLAVEAGKTRGKQNLGEYLAGFVTVVPMLSYELASMAVTDLRNVLSSADKKKKITYDRNLPLSGVLRRHNEGTVKQTLLATTEMLHYLSKAKQYVAIMAGFVTEDRKCALQEFHDKMVRRVQNLYVEAMSSYDKGFEEGDVLDLPLPRSSSSQFGQATHDPGAKVKKASLLLADLAHTSVKHKIGGCYFDDYQSIAPNGGREDWYFESAVNPDWETRDREAREQGERMAANLKAMYARMNRRPYDPARDKPILEIPGSRDVRSRRRVNIQKEAIDAEMAKP